MQILKTFIDSTGHRHKVGADVPEDWDKPTLEHYLHHGMIGPADAAKGLAKAPAKAKQRAAPGPQETKPSGPQEPGDLQPADTGAKASPAEGAGPELPL